MNQEPRKLVPTTFQITTRTITVQYTGFKRESSIYSSSSSSLSLFIVNNKTRKLMLRLSPNCISFARLPHSC